MVHLMDMAAVIEGLDNDTHRCPRCDAPAEQRFYGPCGTCRSVLRSKYETSNGDRIVDGADEGFVGKMNVTPNAVALKDD